MINELSPQEQTTIRKLQDLLEQVRRSRVVCVPRMSCLSDIQENLFDSRFGGPYAWPNDNGSPAPPRDNFFCLLQLNLSDLAVSAPSISSSLPLPKTGLLQFFIRADTNYGMNDLNYLGPGFEIVHHDPSRTANWQQRHPSSGLQTDLLPLGNRSEAMLGVGIPIASFIHQDNLSPSRNDYRFEKTTLSLLWDSDQQQCRTTSSMAFERWYEENIIPLDHQTSDAVAWLGGHPRLSQGDIRTNYPNQNYEALLSLASDGDIFQWGDMGDATFLIRRDDLKNRDFSKALYSWDCF